MSRFILFLILVLTASCGDPSEEKDNAGACGASDPINELTWLKEEIESRKQNPNGIDKYFYIEQGEYQKQTVFLYNNCCPMCNTTIPVYACDGTKLFDSALGIDIKNIKIVWKPADFPCQIQ
jgi:hypothetical protein